MKPGNRFLRIAKGWPMRMEQPPPLDLTHPLTFNGRTTARGSLYFAVGFFVVMMLLTCSLLLMKPFWVGTIAVVIGGSIVWLFMLRMTFQSLALVAGRIVLDSSGMTIHQGAGARTIPWADLASVTPGRSSLQELKLLTRSGPTVSLQLFYIEDGSELGRILKQIAGGSVPAVSPKPQPVPANPSPSPLSLSAPRVFKPKPSSWGGPFAGILMFGFFVAGGIGMITTATNSGQTWVGAFFIFIFGIFFVVSVAMLVVSRTTYIADSHSLEARSLLSTKKIEWAYVESAIRGGSEMTSYKLKAKGKTFSVETAILAEGPELIQLIDSQLAQAKSQTLDNTAGRAFGVEPGFKALVILLFGIFGPLMAGYGIYGLTGGMARPSHPEDAAPSTVLGLLYVLCGGLLVVMIPMVLIKRYTPHAHSLEVRTLKGTRTIDFDHLRRVELGTRRQPRSSTLYRTMILEHPDGEVRIDSNIEDFGALEEYILAHVNPAIVRDSRPPGG